jgi:hypothetical protein
VFGYDNVEVRDGGRPYVDYRMNDQQAEVVRDIFLDRNPGEARTALEALLAGPLSCAPIESPEGKRYAITGKIAVGSLFTIDSVPRGTLAMVNMSGFDGLDAWTVPISLVA